MHNFVLADRSGSWRLTCSDGTLDRNYDRDDIAEIECDLRLLRFMVGEDDDDAFDLPPTRTYLSDNKSSTEEAGQCVDGRSAPKDAWDETGDDGEAQKANTRGGWTKEHETRFEQLMVDLDYIHSTESLAGTMSLTVAPSTLRCAP